MTTIIVDAAEFAFDPSRVSLGDVYFLGHDGHNPEYCVCIVTERIEKLMNAVLCKTNVHGLIEIEHLSDVTFVKSASTPESFAQIHRVVSCDRRYFRNAMQVKSLTEPFVWKCSTNPCQCNNKSTRIITPHGKPKPCREPKCHWVDVSSEVRGYILASHQLGVRP